MLLIEGGANVNARDSYMRAPIHDACANGHVEMLHCLAENHADVCAENDVSALTVSG